MINAKTESGKKVIGYYCRVEGRHFIIPEDAEIDNPDCAEEGIFGIIEINPETIQVS